jgi:hypothetical protein
MFSQELSRRLYADRIDKPVIRGEVGWLFTGDDLFAQNASNGVWLHNFIWAGVNPGGLIEHFWVGAPTHQQIFQSGSHDHRPEFRSYYDFIKNVPLNNGFYKDAEAQASDPALRAWGQKDTTHGRAHLWIQNKHHTWSNVARDVAIPPVSATVVISGFTPGSNFRVIWWGTYQGKSMPTQTIKSDPSGNLFLSISNLKTDVAVKIEPDGFLRKSK